MNVAAEFDSEYDEPVVFLEPVNDQEKMLLETLAQFQKVRFKFEIDDEEAIAV